MARTAKARAIGRSRRAESSAQSLQGNGHVWRIAAVLVLAFAAYSNCFSAGLIFDNAKIILDDPRIHQATWSNARQLATGEYWPNLSTTGLYRPLTSLSYLVNYAVLGNGSEPEGYHWVNLGLHSINACLVYAAGILVLGNPGGAMALALLWAVHPVLTESVTNVVGRADLLAAAGVLTGLLCYARFLKADSGTRYVWLGAMILAQIVGLFSKENAIVLPGILLCYDLAWPGRDTTRKRILPYTALGVVCGAFLYLRHFLGLHLRPDFLENPLIVADFWTGRLTAIKVAGSLLWKFFWPQRLSADYSYRAIPLFGWRLDRPEDWKAILSLVIYAVGLGLCWKWRRDHPALFFFAGLFFVAILPTSNLVILIGSILAERFLYLASVGLAGCTVCLASRLVELESVRSRPWSRCALPVVMCVATLALGARTYARNLDWKNDISLWTSAVQAYPDNARAHYNFGTALLIARAPEAEVEAELEKAVHIAPDQLWEAHYNLANILVRNTDRLPDAIREYQATLRINPGFVEARVNLGLSLGKSGRQVEAASELARAVRDSPDDAKAHYDLGNAFFRMPGRLPDAIREWRAATRIDPNFAEAHYNLGTVLSSQPGHLDEGIAEFEATVRVRPDDANSRYRLARALARAGRDAEAVMQFDAAAKIRPDPEEKKKFDETRFVSGRLPARR